MHEQAPAANRIGRSDYFGLGTPVHQQITDQLHAEIGAIHRDCDECFTCLTMQQTHAAHIHATVEESPRNSPRPQARP